MSDLSDKLACFQAITGLQDTDLCMEILSARGWDLEQAISSITSTSTSNSDNNNPSTTSATSAATADTGRVRQSGLITGGGAGPLGLAWKLVTLPISIMGASLGLVTGAIGLGLWVAGGVLSYSLSMIGLTNSGGNRELSSVPSVSVSTAASEAVDFLSDFESQYGNRHPNFVAEAFTDAVQRSRREFKLLFVYLHSPDHPDSPPFCKGTLCSEVLSAFVNENFVAWGDSIMASEGLKMSKSLKASRFPFCAVVMAATGQSVSLLRQFEGTTSAEEMLTELQRVLEESVPALVAARLDAKEHRNNTRLREEQDAAYQAALEADQAKERQKKEDQNQLEREERAREIAARESAENEAALAKLCEEKALSLGPEPEKGPDATQVLVRLPSGVRQGRRFDRTATLQSLYDFVDSSGCLEVGSYTLVTFFPRVLYGQDKLSSTLEELGLHPQASLFVELDS